MRMRMRVIMNRLKNLATRNLKDTRNYMVARDERLMKNDFVSKAIISTFDDVFVCPKGG